ncbi:MAG: hypothetical protein FWG25_11405 [Promicromonosporaceae bacterium]|nr:hypothetical protein [Promicromonosporaceae bacterium]
MVKFQEPEEVIEKVKVARPVEFVEPVEVVEPVRVVEPVEVLEPVAERPPVHKETLAQAAAEGPLDWPDDTRGYGYDEEVRLRKRGVDLEDAILLDKVDEVGYPDTTFTAP